MIHLLLKAKAVYEWFSFAGEAISALGVNELAAWRARFPAYEYRPQDECVALRLIPGQPANKED